MDLDPGTQARPVVLVIQNDATCPVAMVGEWLLELGLELHVLAADAGEPLPPDVPAGIDAVISLGGVIGAYDDEDAPWLPAERALLADAVATGVPVLGLCLGGQLLAAATGGRVEVADTAELGVVEVSRTMDGLGDPVIGSALAVTGTTIPSAQWHLDHISELPDAAVLLMTSADCAVQAFRLGETAYGLQMHPEIDSSIVDAWAAESGEVVPRSRTTSQEAADAVRAHELDLFAAWRPAIRAWGDLVWLRARTFGTASSS